MEQWSSGVLEISGTHENPFGTRLNARVHINPPATPPLHYSATPSLRLIEVEDEDENEATGMEGPNFGNVC